MTPILMKSMTALAAFAGLTFTSMDETTFGAAYGDNVVSSLSRDEIADHAKRVFARADRNADSVLDVDEYTALSVVTVELARLNGFITIETGEEPGVVELPGAASAALTTSEHTRIAAVSQTAFYVHAGADGVMTADEFVAAQQAFFDAADLNRNQFLKRRELSIFAQRQASMRIDV